MSETLAWWVGYACGALDAVLVVCLIRALKASK